MVPIMCCVTLDRLSPLSVPLFPYLYNGVTLEPRPGAGHTQNRPCSPSASPPAPRQHRPVVGDGFSGFANLLRVPGTVRLTRSLLSKVPEARHDQKGSREGQVYNACCRRALWSL